jgi:hypothetical protein
VDLFAIDDSIHKKPTRKGMRPLVAVGGLHVPGDKVRDLELALDALCDDFGFPQGEEFKWSPEKRLWEHSNLVGERRDEFNLKALNLAREAGAQGIVTMTDTKTSPIAGADTHEEAATLMFLERAQACLPPGRDAVVVFDRHGGGQRSELAFLTGTLTTMRTGTTYSGLDRLALAVATDSKLSRLVQLADVVTSCSTSYVAGEPKYAPKVFKGGVLPLLRSDFGCVGGRGLKLHPDFSYRNLYHWLLGDDMFVRAQTGQPLPSKGYRYSESADDP